MFYPTAALVIEVVSPGDESWEKLGFYAAHGVDELLMIDPQEKTVSWLGLAGDEYKQVERSRLVELGAVELARDRIRPPQSSSCGLGGTHPEAVCQ